MTAGIVSGFVIGTTNQLGFVALAIDQKIRS